MPDLVIMPRLSLNEETSLLSEWYVEEGDQVGVGDKLFCIETDKSTMEVDSEFAGVVLKKYYSDYEVVDVLSPVCVIGQPGDEIPELDIPEAKETEAAAAEIVTGQQQAAAPKETTVASGPLNFSPRARILAEKNGITANAAINPSGADNRVLEEDIIRYMESGDVSTLVSSQDSKEVKKLSKIRKVIGTNMMGSLHNTAQLTLNTVFNASGIMSLREQFKKEQGAMKNVTIGDLILFATAKTLAELTYMNTLAEGDQEVVEYKTVNLGCAVDTERGLMVPTLFGAEQMSLLELSNQVKELAGQCNAGNISPDKLSGGTFTVSNLGAFGIRQFTPILNPPQIGILGVGAVDYMIKNTKEGMLYYPAVSLSLTIDHRIIDGGPGARFLKRVCGNLEKIEEFI